MHLVFCYWFCWEFFIKVPAGRCKSLGSNYQVPVQMQCNAKKEEKCESMCPFILYHYANLRRRFAEINSWWLWCNSAFIYLFVCCFLLAKATGPHFTSALWKNCVLIRSRNEIKGKSLNCCTETSINKDITPTSTKPANISLPPLFKRLFLVFFLHKLTLLAVTAKPCSSSARFVSVETQKLHLLAMWSLPRSLGRGAEIPLCLAGTSHFLLV